MLPPLCYFGSAPIDQVWPKESLRSHTLEMR